MGSVSQRIDALCIDTCYGRLKGFEVAPGLSAFWGVPYAAPPVGLMRWRPPEAPLPWEGVRDAAQFGCDPIQPIGTRKSRAPGQSEDCLYLNIWKPTEIRAEGWPVLVWLSGGAFTTGSGAFVEENPQHLAAKGAVVVSVNVRLNIFGFFAHPGLSAESLHGASGNYGIMDLAAALRWVRLNIAAFGGDPDRITFFGESAGATMGLLLSASPFVSRPYDRAIFQSPGSFNALLPLADAERHGAGLGERVDDLRALPAQDLMARANRLPPVSPSLWLARPLRPIVDGWMIRSDNPTASADLRPIPAIIGTNEDEGRFFEARMGISTKEDFAAFAERIFGEGSAAAIAFYRARCGDDVPSMFSALYGDRGFNMPIRALCRDWAQAGGKAHRYVYTHRHSLSDRAPTHGDEIGVLMDLLARKTTTDAQMADAMARIWLSFAETGVVDSGSVIWPQYDAKDDTHLQLAIPPSLATRWRADEIDFVARSRKD